MASSKDSSITSTLHSLRDPIPVSRFYVFVDAKIHGVFSEISGLQAEIDVTNHEEGGNNTTLHRLPGRLKVGNLVFKTGLCTASEFLPWLLNIASGIVEKKNISVILFNAAGVPMYQWDFLDAYPFKWSCNALKADSTEVAIETLELAYSSMRVGGTT